MKTLRRVLSSVNYELTGLLIVGALLYCWLLFLNQYFLEGIPHVGDAVSYVWQAKFLSTGNIAITPSIFSQYYDFFKGWEPLFFRDGKYFGPYPFGHPLLLVPGVLLGVPGIMPPFIGVSMVVAIYFIVKKLAGWKMAIIGALLAITSPFFQMHAVSFMSHNSASLFTAGAILLIINHKKRNQLLSLFLSGILFGLLLNTRPLASISFFPMIILLCFYFSKSIKAIVAFLAGFGMLLSFYFLSNYILTGNAISPPYSVYLVPLKTAFPIINVGKLTVEVENFKRAYKLFLEVINGWPIGFTIIVPLLSLLNRRLVVPVMLLWLGIISHLVLHFFFYDPGITYGPRMWYELFPLVIIIMSIGIRNLFVLFSTNYYLKYVTLIIVTLLMLRSSVGWVTGSPVLYSYYFTPSSIQHLKTFNYVDARLIKEAKKQNIYNAVIFVKANEFCDYQWWCYGSVMAQNNVTFDSDIVWATDLGVRNLELKTFYPDRSFYVAEYNSGKITKLPL